MTSGEENPSLGEQSEASWSKFFLDKSCVYSGNLGSLRNAEELIREFTLQTTTAFAVWKTEKKNFGSTGIKIIVFYFYSSF